MNGAPQILTSEAERNPPQERPQQFHFWVVTNIPGNDVALGNEMIAYDSPLALELDGSRINKDYPPHHSPILVFEQKGGRVGNCPDMEFHHFSQLVKVSNTHPKCLR